MAKFIGTVTQVVGEVFAVAGDGTRRALFEGDRLFAGEQLQTGASGAVAVHLADGGELTLGRDSSMPLTTEILANHATHVDTPDTSAPSQAQLTDVEQIQKAIAAGDDPTKTADPTAAGPGAGGATGALGGGHSFVLLDAVGGSVDPVIGFPTAGFNGIPEFPEGRIIGLNDQSPDAPLPPIDHDVTLNGLDVSGGELSVDEANLPQGSTANPGALTQNGSFTINAADGLSNLNIGGIDVITNGAPSGFPQSITSPLGNTLTITGYNPDTGVVTYTYTLNGADNHAPGDGANNLGESFPVVATDNDGDTAHGSIDVNITDDVPKAFDDTNESNATENHTTLTGSVLPNDIQGADRIPTGPIVGGTFVGTYGTLVLAADGSYTYTLNSSDPDFVALHGGGNGTETFTYTLQDADGDTSQANLVLNIHNDDDQVLINGLNAEGSEVTVYEKNLGTGSSPDAGSLTQTGTFTVNAADGLQSLTVGGINVVIGGVANGFPQSIPTDLGNTLTITGYNAETGVVSYSYTLNGADSHPDGVSEHFNVVATDSDGDVANGSLDVNVVDDAPKANDDSNSNTASENAHVLSGEVLSNDVQGADRIPTGPIVGGTFVGTYGTLVLAADGSYTYTLNSNDPEFVALHGGGNGTETFTYTIQDADGDTSQANLVLNIHNDDDQVLINGLNVEGGELNVYEGNLAIGSNPDVPQTTQSGTFTVNAADGLQTLTIDGIKVVVGGVASGFPQSVTTDLGNTLTITGYNAETGVVSYSYTLNDAEKHPDGGHDNVVSEHFDVVATDSDGDTAHGSLDVNIVDDFPLAHDDSNKHTATEDHTKLFGNVLNNDIQGADRIPTGPIVGGTFVGTYGTLVLAADGTYTYTLNSNDPDFVALHGGGNGTETFTYTIKDADGDTSQANLVLQVHNNDDGVLISGLHVKGGELNVYEGNLAIGSNPDVPQTTQSGTFTVNAADGLQTLTIDGIKVVVGGVANGFPQSVTTDLGNTLTITGYNAETGVVSYSYTLNDAEKHPNGGHDNVVSEHFNVVATDSDGDTAHGSLDVNIVDDFPLAHDDTNKFAATEDHTKLGGNVLTNDIQGADRVPGGPVLGGTFVGTYGTLVLGNDGSYTYTLNSNDPDFIALHGGGNGTETFTYTIKDADGDTSQAKLVLQVHNNDDCVTIECLDVKGGELNVYEGNLAIGSNPDVPQTTQTGTFTVKAADGLQTLTIDGLKVVVGGVAHGFPQSITTDLGNTLTITGYNAETGVVSYSYTLNDAEKHPDGGHDNVVSEHFNVVATDSDGDTAHGSLDVNIVDDFPLAHDDTNKYTASEDHTKLGGNVLTNDIQGADRIPTGPIVGGTFVGTYGTLVLAANGSYTYTLNSHDPDFVALHGGGNGTDTFTYTIKDADGDTSQAKLVLQVHNNDDCVTIECLDVKGGELTVHESNLSDGSHPDVGALVQSGTFTVDAPDGLQSLNIGGINVISGGVVHGFPQSIATLLGNLLTVTGYNPTTGVVSYSYTLNDAEKHPDAHGDNSISEHLTVVATDGDGDSSTGIIDVNIVDDTPKALADSGHITEGGIISGSVLDNDTAGADGAGPSGLVIGARAGSDTSHSAIGNLGTAIEGHYGTLFIDAAGTATYYANSNSVNHGGADDVFTYSIRDADGDVSTTTLTITVDDSGLKAVDDCGTTVFEGALDLTKGGSDLAPGTVVGSHPDSPGETASGSLAGSVSGGESGLTFSLVGSNNGTLTGQYGEIHLNSDGTYTYTLTSAPKSGPADDGPNVTSDTFTYKATDALGNSVTAHIVVSIVDDVPQAACIDRSVTSSQVDSNVLLVVDVSGSMNDASGNGQSRLDLAKQAMITLLDKYDEMGNVKVQIVTFSDDSHTPSNVWVDVATAKSIINGLHADGGTNYDYALSEAQHAFDTAGKLAGGQNVSYFFSDGNPTLSDTHPTSGHGQDGSQTNPELGDGISGTEEAAWISFLNSHDVKSIAIGIGDGVNSNYLNPIAYDGSTGTNTNSVVVTDPHNLSAVLAGTVQGAPVTGSLLTEGTVGADGGFIKAIVVDGVSYLYDPKANGNQGGYSVVGGDSHGTFDTTTNSITVASHNGGTLVVDMDNGEYTYTPPKVTGSNTVTENFGYVISDNDGDLAGANLVVRVNPNTPPVAGDDHVITNILSPNIVVPAEMLLANDSDANGDKLSATPTSFNTGWATKSADFTAANAKPIDFSGAGNSSANQLKTVERSDFFNMGSLTALVVLNGYLGAANGSANAQDLYSVTLHKGETVTLDNSLDGRYVKMEWLDSKGASHDIVDGGKFTADADGVYKIHVTNIQDTDRGHSSSPESYQLHMSLNYAGASDVTPDYHSTYNVSDGHGGSDSAAVDITYQAGNTLLGTTGNDVLLGGSGNDHLHGGDGNDVLNGGAGNNELFGDNGNDVLFSGPGNDLLDGGAGNNTASYANATAGVHVDLGIITAQNTLGAGTDTLTNIDNLIGSNFDDHLTGGSDNNVLNGGLGNDFLNGGGGDDILIGGMGNNTLTGGSGSDTFKWEQGNVGHDLVTDFSIGVDKLDLSQLLQGENSSSASLDDYLHFKVTGSGESLVTTIEVGSMAGSGATQTIDLAGVDLATHYGVSPGAGGVVAGGHDTASIIKA